MFGEGALRVELRCLECGLPGSREWTRWECIGGHVRLEVCVAEVVIGGVRVWCQRIGGHIGSHIAPIWYSDGQMSATSSEAWTWNDGEGDTEEHP